MQNIQKVSVEIQHALRGTNHEGLDLEIPGDDFTTWETWTFFGSVNFSM